MKPNAWRLGRTVGALLLVVLWTLAWALVTPRGIGVAFEGEPQKIGMANGVIVLGWLLGVFLIYGLVRPRR